MKKLFLFGFCFLLFSCTEKINCDGKVFDNYDMYVDYSINQLKSPVTITSISTKIYKTDITDTLYSIVVRDSKNTIHLYNYNSDLVNVIARTHNVGDTIR